MTPLEVHRVLSRALFDLVSLHGQLPQMPFQTVWAIGEATGMVSRAKTLVEREMARGNDGSPGI